MDRIYIYIYTVSKNVTFLHELVLECSDTNIYSMEQSLS
jgi:hypothetical protein